MAEALAKRTVVDDETVVLADDAALEEIGKALDSPKASVHVQLGGHCTFTARRGQSIGWESQYSPEHILEAADAGFTLILQHL
ncbi:hypothetical protein BDV28DRAFT_149064 [Aspergillus coremiiformis]|uniref:Uncharacterized protein n=1 Tax=Aspergillus coremiiformis TaxID=138285 RepID=A0A5N6Z3Y9_9EURO|nr:hypothetical protein BDV28DRAFT_149064 [Aspergillus coremiiformis]